MPMCFPKIAFAVLMIASCCLVPLPVAIAMIQATDIGWPRQIAADGNKLVYYQPQVDSWDDYKQLKARIAFALTPKGEAEVHGVASFSCQTIVDKEVHTAYFKTIDVEDVRFPTLSYDKKSQLEYLFRKLFPKSGETISVERVMADLNSKGDANPVKGLNNEPPPIFFTQQPAVLLIVQGEEVLSGISKTKLEFLVNANWDVFHDKSDKSYYLLAENLWFRSKGLKGPWDKTQTLPKEMSKLPAGENFDDVKKMIPPRASDSTRQVFFSDKPAELIAIDGPAVFTKIEGTSLLYVANSENDLFVDNSTKKFFVLLSGRWFSASELKGPWSYAGDNLPTDFSKIPENSKKSYVLASVPGTIEASDAVMLAQIPTSAIVNKKEAETKAKVTYDGGKPVFKPIEGTEMQYATNTQEKVILYSKTYYLCFQAVWFTSVAPDGPWKVATVVPEVIYTIPPNSPVYNVVYVKQTVQSETTVQTDVAAGYFGAFIIGVGVAACIAYGTGWFYPPYLFRPPGMLYPIYRPYPCSYGAGFVYNPWTGGFAGGRRVYGPYGTAGTSAWFNPATGRYGRAASVQGWYGGRTAAQSYNPWTGRYAATSQGHNPYSQWGSSVVSRGGNWVQTGHVTNAAGTTAGYRTSTGQHGVIHTGANGTFVGHDGNIYRKNNNGNWSQFNNGSWQQSVGGNEGTRHELDRSAQARDRGLKQTGDFQNFRQNRKNYSGARFGRH